MLRNAVGGVSFPRKNRYEDVRFNVLVLREGGWGRKRYVTLEWSIKRL